VQTVSSVAIESLRDFLVNLRVPRTVEPVAAAVEGSLGGG